MERIAIKSSHVVSVGYDEDERCLEVEFAPKREGEPGPIWHYSPVARRDYEALLNGESAGRFVNALRKDPMIVAERIEAEA